MSDPGFFNKSNVNIKHDLTSTQSTKHLIKALKSKLLEELMLHIKTFAKEELKFSKEENDLDNSNIKPIKSLEKKLEFLKQ